MNEHPFMKHLMIALGTRRDLKIWRQNCGKVPIRDDDGRVLRVFDAGPPKGAADLSGIVIPEGWRLEIEVKADGGRVSPAQKRWRDFIVASGGVHAVVKFDDGATLEENVARAVATIEQAIVDRGVRGIARANGETLRTYA